MKKKVLALADYESCFLSHTLLTGLWEQDDVEVYELPVLQSVRGGIDDQYTLRDGTRGMTGCPGYLQPAPLPPQTHTVEDIVEEVLDQIDGFDLVVLLSGRRYALDALMTLCLRTGKAAADLPLVLCDGEDSETLNTALIGLLRPKAVFKRELLREIPLATYAEHAGCPVLPCQFGAFYRSLPFVPEPERGSTFDFFLSLGLTHSCRQTLLETCLQMNLPRSYIAGDGNNPLRERYPQMAQMLSWPAYMDAMQRAKVTAAIRGFGRDCLHTWEAFMSGAGVLFAEPGLWMPHPFIDRQHCLYFREDCSDFLGHLALLLHEEGYRQDIAAAGKRHALEFHSCQARGKYLLNISERILGGEKIDPEEFGLC